MKTLITPLLLVLLLAPLTGCKKYVSSAPKFGDSGSASSDDLSSSEDEETSSGEGEGEEETESGEGEEEEEAAAGASLESFTVWSGSSLFGAISGDGYKIDAKTLKITPIAKGLVGDVKSSKAQDIAEDQILEVVALVEAAKEGTPTHTLATCASDKLLAQLYISMTESGTETVVGVADTATCTSAKYITNASFQKITAWFKTNYPPEVTSTTTPTALQLISK